MKDELKEHVVFLGSTDDSPISLEEEDNRQYAVWDVYNTPYAEIDEKFYYSASFRVRVDNTADDYIFNHSGDLETDTNAETILEYFFEPNGDGSVPTHKQTLLFHHKSSGSDLENDGRISVPRVKTFSADLEFIKLYNDGFTPLPQVGFALVLVPPKDAIGISPYQSTATSDAEGMFSFCDIPSGHIYTIMEIDSEDEGGEAGARIKIADVEIAYGEIYILDVTDPGYASFSGSRNSYKIVNEEAEAPEVPEPQGELDELDGLDELDETGEPSTTNSKTDRNDDEEEQTAVDTQRDEQQQREEPQQRDEGNEDEDLLPDEKENAQEWLPSADLTQTEAPFTPGGTDPNHPPNPNVSGRELLRDDGGYIEFDENGAPLGRWAWDEDMEMWVFDVFPPLGRLPGTGSNNNDLWIAITSVSPLGLGVAMRMHNRKRGKHEV